MRQYNGILIHRSVVGEDNLDVVDSGSFRSLHFDSASIQSRLLRSDPAELVIEYTQAMMLALAYQPAPRRVLLLGLGGGSQARFLLKYFPDCHIDAVEISPSVSELARRFFYLEDSERLCIHHMDGAEYLRTHSEQTYDLILVDAFTRDGPVDSMFEPKTLNAMYRSLNKNGVCSINSWKDDPYLYAASCHEIQAAFARPLFDISLTDDPENIVLLIPMQTLATKQLLRNSKHIQKQTGLKLLKHLKNLAELEVNEASKQ
ncbi:MAG: fused MFS/spermidine synthase [Gammaproteobacteria bacterium]|nr:fused MFS/spermidine synthase [Gammaproteobacteria bacterium]